MSRYSYSKEDLENVKRSIENIEGRVENGTLATEQVIFALNNTYHSSPWDYVKINKYDLCEIAQKISDNKTTFTIDWEDPKCSRLSIVNIFNIQLVTPYGNKRSITGIRRNKLLETGTTRMNAHLLMSIIHQELELNLPPYWEELIFDKKIIIKFDGTWLKDNNEKKYVIGLSTNNVSLSPVLIPMSLKTDSTSAVSFFI